MKTTQTFSILIWANKSKASKSGLPLYARVTVNGKRAEISLKRNVDPEKWDFSKGKLKGNTVEARSINNYIQEIKSELYKIYHHMASMEQFITADLIKKKFTGEEAPRKTILEIIKFHNEEMKRSIGFDVVRATWVKFNTLESKVTSYIKTYRKKSDFFLEELDHRFVTEFEYYLRAVDKIHSNTSMKYIRMLKKILNDAVRKDWLKTNPFQNFKCTFKWPEREVLSYPELQKIIDKEFGIERLQIVKDLFIFSCFTGLAYIDLVNLNQNHISTGIDGNLWIIKDRQKTDTTSHIPLLPVAKELIDKYKMNPRSVNNESVFPKISNQKMNSYLKEIGDLCGISKILTFHLARHTFATTVTLANGVPIESVSKMLGHTKITTTQIYAKVVETKLSEDMNELNKRLAKSNLNLNIKKAN